MTAGLSALPRLRARANNVARRAARRLLTHNLARRLRRPEISVIVPFYNVEQYLAECLDSLLGQSYGDFEVLLVDDGSPDGSRAIADRYAAQDSRFRLVTRPNGGLGAARNTGPRRPDVRGQHDTPARWRPCSTALDRAALGVLTTDVRYGVSAGR